LIHFLFFLSGLSGLVYQVVWVRVFGNVFGNTIYSAAIVVAVFMLGLGAGSWIAGAWADRRYARMAHEGGRHAALLSAYGYFELAIGALGLGVALLLPRLAPLSAAVSSYVVEPSGWYALSAASYLARVTIAVVLLTPITILMGGTLTLLIRHLVHADLDRAGWRVAALYGINTAGAAVGALVTDFSLVPLLGLLQTQSVAAFCNVIAGIGALVMASARNVRTPAPDTRRRKRATPRTDAAEVPARQVEAGEPRRVPLAVEPRVFFTALALACTGFAALGMEILWFRHFSILLGGFRAVFALLLALILTGVAVGSLIGGAVDRRTRRPAEWFMVVQALFVAFTLGGLALADVDVINRTDATFLGAAAAPGTIGELWFNTWPMLLEVAVPALLMGFSFPLANAIVQNAELSVGRRAGGLYLANTAGAVAGSVAAGFLTLPVLGLQRSATVFMTCAALSLLPLYAAARPSRRALAGSLVIAGVALGAWLQLPADFMMLRALGTPDPAETRLTAADGLTELVAVTESQKGRTLVTNGHAMSSTWPLSQRYMRALAHIPLLSIENPETVLVVGFGVGNTTQAATLHPTVRRVELADLSRDILAHASYFAADNKGVLKDPKVAVYINDGRQHLQMQPPGSYDLIVLEPPPIAYAGVSALYSREFYQLARTRLQPQGYLSQWLPAYQVPADIALAMVASFVDVFPESVLLSGAGSDLILLGTNGSRIEADPDRLEAALSRAPTVREDLSRVDLGSVHEIVGTFVGSAQRLREATSGIERVIDDRPIQEYGVHSMLNIGHGVPGGLVDLAGVAEWCSRCFADGKPVPSLARLDEYFQLLSLAYDATRAEGAEARLGGEMQGRTVAGSRYLGAIVPESADLHNVLGLGLAQRGQLDAAILEFRHALQLDADDAAAHWHLGVALVQKGDPRDALMHLERSVELDPENSQAQSDLGLLLAMQGRLDEAHTHLNKAVTIDPDLQEARRNLALVEERLRQGR
jgi:spermidine synthase